MRQFMQPLQRRSIYRRDTAPVFNQPDWAGMYSSMSQQRRNERRYGEQVRRQRQHDFSEMTKMSLDPNITDQALKDYEMGGYNTYMDKVKNLAATKDGKFSNEDIINLRQAQGLMMQLQSQARGVQQRMTAASKEIADPRNEGLYDEDYYNKAMAETRTYFKTGGKEGVLHQSFLDENAEQTVPFFSAIGDDIANNSYEYEREEGGEMVRTKYKSADLTKEQAQDIITREMKASRRLRKGVIEDWKSTPNGGGYETYEEFAINNKGYLDPIMGKRDLEYGRRPLTKAERGAGDAPDDGSTHITYNQGEGGYLLGALDKGQAFRINEVTVGGETFKNGAVTMVNPDRDLAVITLDVEDQKEVDMSAFDDWDPEMKAMMMMANKVDQSKKVDKFMLKKIYVPFSKVGTMLKDAKIVFDPVEGGTGAPISGKYDPASYGVEAGRPETQAPIL